MLTSQNIRHHRIDGTVGLLDRQQRLSEYQYDPDINIPVLLLSIETGAVGYELVQCSITSRPY